MPLLPIKYYDSALGYDRLDQEATIAQIMGHDFHRIPNQLKFLLGHSLPPVVEAF